MIKMFIMLLVLGMFSHLPVKAQGPKESPIILRSNYSIDVDRIAFFISCNSEPLSFTGSLHVHDLIVVLDNKYISHSQISADDVMAISSSGQVYRLTAFRQNEITNFSFRNGSSEFNVLSHYQLRGPGPENNFVYRMNAHITTNADGTTTVDQIHWFADCR